MRHRVPRRPGHRPRMRPPGPGRRPPPHVARRAAWTPPPPQLEAARGDVARAHELMAAGDYQEASELFSRVAALAAGHQRFRRAGQLYAQAMRAMLQADNLTQTMAYADRAIGALIQSQDLPLASHVVGRMEETLRASGHEAEAQTLRDKFNARLEELGLSPGDILARTAAPPAPKRELPAQCSACLGPVRSDEVEWIDETSAACAYCGSVLKAE